MQHPPEFTPLRPGLRLSSALVKTLATALLPLLSACTPQAWYEGSRAGARQQCNTLPPGAYEECMGRVNDGVGRQSYESYEQERERLRQK